MTSHSRMIITRPKVNLYLHVTGRREDGYHLLDSLVVFPDIEGDKITLTPSSNYSLEISGPYAGKTGDVADNLITRAANLYFELMGRRENIAITLEKNLPVGAGLGGGSSDAAATLRTLEYIYGPLPSSERDEILATLGADVPVCYRGETARFSGIGEKIETLPSLPQFHMLLIWPGVTSSTPAVFKEYKEGFSAPASLPSSFSSAQDVVAFLATTRNDLTAAATTLHPSIATALTALQNSQETLLSRMSGSGSSVFGLYDSAEKCAAAASMLKILYPSWWIKKGPVL